MSDLNEAAIEAATQKWEDLKDRLKTEILQVTFTKKDGTNRVMTCTLKEDVIPQATKEDTLSLEKVRKINIEVMPVWDTEAEGWRSFRIDSIKEIVSAS